MFTNFNLNHFDALAFVSGTSTLTVAGHGLLSSSVLVALIVLLTRIVEWRIKARTRRQQAEAADELLTTKQQLTAALQENNRLLRKIAGEPESPPQSDH